MPPPSPGYSAPAYPGAPKAGTPGNKKPGLVAVISAVVLVVLVGGILLTLGLTKTGPFAPSSANNRTTPTTSTVPAGFKLFTNQDKTFSIIYPEKWSVKDPISISGVGKEFDGPANQVLQVSNGGSSQSSETGTSDDAFCLVFGATTNAHTTVTIDGQTWTREECDSYASISHAIVETVVYKGNLYLLSYAAPKDTFNSDRTRYFTPMEESFTFLAQVRLMKMFFTSVYR